MDPSLHVTAVISHGVRPGREAPDEHWMRGIAAHARRFPGHLGVHILRPQPGGYSDYVIVLQFDTCSHLQAWLHSEQRRGWIEQAQPLIREQESNQVLTGLEAWFQSPGQRGTPQPRRYKQAVLVWLGVTGISLLVSPHLTALLAFWPWVPRVAVHGALTVGLLTYVVMPFLTRGFRAWLFPG